MQDIREINNLIKEKIKTPELSDIYAAVAHNSHLDFAAAVKLGAAFGAVAECDTYDGWNSRGIRVRRGQHAIYEIPERTAAGIKAKNYFSVEQTTSANRNKRTLQSLFKHLNDYSFMKVNAAKVDFAALCAAVRNYASDNGISFNADFEQIVVTGIASVLAHTCKDSSSIEIAPQPFPDRDYLENAKLLKEVGEYALNLLELVEIAESKAEDQHSDKSNVSSPVSTAQTASGTQIDLFDIKPDTAQQQTPQPEPVADSPAVPLLPMYQTYLAKKAAYPGTLVFQRVGDFYEVLGEEDTKKLSEILDLTITGRMVGLPERMPMVGIPFHAIDDYVSRLLEEGTYQKIVVADEMPEVSDRVVERTPELAVSIEEAKAEAAARQVTFEEGREKARAEAERTGEPYVTIEWSENPAFHTGDIFSFYQADNLFTKLDKEFSDLGYDKVKFHIDFTYKGEIEDYEGRYDIGDKDNGLINHIDSFGRYAKTEEARRDFAELCQYLRLHKDLSDLLETFEGSEEEKHAVFEYIKTTRATLNSTEYVADFVLPEPPEVLRSNKQFNEIMYGADEEAAPVQEEQPNTVVAAPMAQEQPVEELDDIAAEEERLTFGGAKTRFKDNLEALKVYRRLSDTGAAATPAEKAILKKYIGWGGLSEVFDVKNAAWAEERRELTKYLSPYEYDAAQSTVTDAFYTPYTVVKGIYAALERFGVKGNNRVLEPSMGVGNFFRVMPDKIKENSELTGVEIDHVTGEIAKLIYPEANITVKGFEKTLLPAAHFDIVVGNVPFGNSKPVDIEKDYNFDLHNFVIAKSVDKTRAGGIIALITTSSTMNEYDSRARQYIADRAKFLGAIRLPYDTFKANANTTVTTDIIFLQKRDEIISSTDSWIRSDWRTVNDDLDKDYLNDYFEEHPEMILGQYKRISGRYGYHTVPMLNEGETLQDKLAEAIAHLPANIFTPIERKTDEPIIDQLPADDSVKNFCLTIVNGKLYQRQGDILVNLPIKATPKNALDRIAAMIELRKEVRNILKIQLDNCTDEELKATQGVLNTHYDAFVKKYGYLHSSANKGLFQNDADCQLLLSLEKEDSETKEISKADIFTKRSISPDTKPQHTDSALDALQICKSERGRVDIKYIEELTGKDFETVVNELKGFIFKNPKLASDYDRYRGYEAAEKYLSGDVKTKLQEAESAAGTNEEYIDNVRALKDVQPADIPAEDIIVSLGATWIDTDIYEQFFCEDILKIPYIKSTYAERVNVSYNDLINGYIVDAELYGARNSEANTNTYGTGYISAVELFEQALNLKSPNIYDADRDADGNPIRVFNPKKTALAREKQTKLKTEFAQWIFSDEKRREYLTKKYNDLFNRNRVAEYDGSSLTFPEMNPLIELNAHQKNAVYRGMADGTVLLHHCVGAGKTYEMDALIMKLRQSGLAHKPLQVVPKATLEQAEIEFRTLYPNANLLVASNDDFKKDRLKAFTAKIALGDWDCIIMSSSQFDRINVSPERRAKKLSEEIEKITTTISRAERARGRKDDGLSVKQLQRILKGKRAELDRLMTVANAEDSMRFEDLGIDYLFVDEAHFYKNKYFFTKMSNVAGINSASSKRASALDLKIDYINELHGGDKGVVFATGTPISNSMSEMYTMQSYLQKEQLRKLGLDTFDAWASTFGEIVKSYELKPSGNGYRTRERFASFVNVPELMTMYGMFADVKMLDELKLPVPNVKYEKVIAPKTAQVAELMLDIAERAERINRGGVDPTVDNMLKITTDGKKIALDPRLFDPTLGEPEGGKLQLCAEKVAEIYHATAENKSTQMIFCDSSTPKSGMSFEKYNSEENFNVYYEMKKKLVELGVAADEIAFIHDYEEDAKIKLKEAMTTGKIRVLLGSTSKCGTGLNVQKKLIAGHHLDIPYRPSDMEQREGRIIRQGNENNDVTIYTYAQEGTFDVYLFQILETKQRFIKQLLDFKIGSRKIEDIADNSVLSYAEMKAAISGNPAIIELEQLKQKIDNLNLLHAEYQRNLFRLQTKINSEYPREIERVTRNIANLESDCGMIAQNKTEEFEITINGRRFEGRTEEAGEAFMAAYNEAAEGGDPFAQYCGFAISKDTRVSLAEAPKLILKGSGKYTLSIGDSGVGALTRLTNLINDFSNKLDREKKGLIQAQNDLAEAQKEVTQPFTRADELAATVARIEELRSTLEISDVATDDVVIDSSETPGEEESAATVENIYRRLPLEYLDKNDIYSEIAQRFSADEIDSALRERTRDPALSSIKTSGIDYSNIGSYSYEDLKAAREKLHSYAIKAAVQERVGNEFEAYRKAIVEKGPEEVFNSSFETYVKTELHDTIANDVPALSDNVWRALNAEGEGILHSLYMDFIGSEYASVNTFDDTAAFIQEYCKQYQSAIMNGETLDDVPEELDTPEKQKIKGIVDRIVSEGTENTSEGNWVVYFDEFKDDEQFVREHKEEIAEALSKREEVSEISIEGESFDTTYYLDFCLSHADSRLPENPASEREETIYYGKNNDDTAFYYFPEKLSFDTLPEIKAEAFRYVVAAPVCYIAQERLDELGIQFLKIDRDISREDLLDYSNYAKTIEKMEDAVSKALDDENARLFAEAEARAAGIDLEANPEPEFLRFTKYGSPINNVWRLNNGEYVAVINNYAQGEQATGYEFYEGYPAGYIIAFDYNAEKGEFVEAAYGFETYEEARKYYKDTYDVDLGESLLPELSEEYRRTATEQAIRRELSEPANLSAEDLLQKQLYGVIYNWKGLKEENSVYTAEQLQAADEDFNPELILQGGAFSANKTYDITKLNGETPEKTAENIRQFLTGWNNDSFTDDDAEMPEGWYWETKTENLFTGRPNPTTERLIKYLNLSEEDLRMKESPNPESTERESQREREQAIAREDYPRDFEDGLTETLLDDIEERRGTLNNPSTEKAKDIVDVRGASRTFYKGYVALMHPLNKNVPDSPVEVYLGKKENYDEKGHYDNSDNSLIFVSTNPKMFSFIRDSLWVYSQQEFIEKGIFSEQDYKEFFDLKNGLLKNMETTGEILFSVDPEKPGSGEPFKYPDWKEISTPKDVHAKAVPKATTLGEDIVNAPSWNKVVLPASAIAIKGDKNVKIVMPEGSEHSGAEFWVSKKFIKNATEKNFKLILPEKYTVQLKTPQGGALSLPAKQVVDELAQHATGYVKEPVVESPEEEVIDLDAGKKGEEVEINPASISELNLSALRQDLVKNLVAAMESGNIDWIRSWATTLPKNGTTGREYAGINNLLLSFEKYKRGYSDSRWCTFKQIQDHKWKLKKGSKAAQIEVVKFIDKTTKKEFNEQSVEGMTEEERKEYWSKNVYPIMRNYSVFNADCIEGIPPEKLNVLNETERNERCEKILANSPAKVYYDGGNDAYYSLTSDTIHLPERERFYSMDDFYYTALHEEGHSTGHPTRLNRNMSGMAGSENYAREELCAEIGSLFMGQSLGLKVSDAQLKSSAAYLKGWATKIKNDPKYLFTAITEANKIAKFVLSLQAGASAANNFAAQETQLEMMQRGGSEKQTGSAFAGKAMGKPDTAKSKNNQTTNIME